MDGEQKSTRSLMISGKLSCPTCGGALDFIKDSRPHQIGDLSMIKRRRACSECHTRHSTFEMIEADVLAISIVMRQMAEADLRKLEAQREAVMRRVAVLSPGETK